MKTAQIAALTLCLLLAAAICHAQEEGFEPTPADQYREHGVTIAMPTGHSPFFFKDASGNNVGYSLELWQLWAKASGLKMRLVPMGREAALKAVQAGDVDVVGGLLHDADLDETVDFSDALHSSRVVLVIRDDGPVDCSNALSAGSVAVAEGSPSDEFMRRYHPDVKTVVSPDLESAVGDFLAGGADAIAIASSQLAKTANERGVMGELNLCRTLFYRELYAGVKKGQTELMELINDGLGNIPQDKLNALEAKWFVPHEEPSKDWLSSVIPAAVAFGCVLVAVFLWMRRRGRKG